MRLLAKTWGRLLRATGLTRAMASTRAMTPMRSSGQTLAFPPTRTSRPARALPLTCAVGLVLALSLAPSLALAEEDENVVNPHQLPDSSFIYDTPMADLAGADSYYDQQTVQVTGEAVGDILNADLSGQYKWVVLASSDSESDDTLAVYMTAGQASLIDTLGRYGATGTTLQVRGTFYLVCSDHDGITCLHADSVSVVKPGSEHPDEFSLRAFAPGAVLLSVGLVMVFVFYYLRERQR